MPANRKRLSRLGLSGAALLFLAACTAYAPAKREIGATSEEASNYMKVRREAQGPTGPANVRVRDARWLGDVGIKSSNGEPLPPKFERNTSITLVSARPLTLAEIAAYITEVTGIPVSGGSSSAPAGSNARAADLIARGDAMPVNWTGPLSGLLNLVAGQFGLSWSYRDGVIRIYDVETRTFVVYASPSKSTIRTEVESTVVGAQDTSSTTGRNETNSSQGVKTEYIVEHWKSLEATIKSMLPDPNCNCYAMMPDAGTITVTAAPAVLDRIEKFVREENERMSRQVAISVKVYSVNLAAGDDYGLDLQDLFYEGMNPESVIVSGLKGLGTSLVDAENTAFKITWKGGKEIKGDVIAKALSTRGDVTLLTSASVTTLNNQPAPVQVATQQGYLKRVSTTQNQTTAETSLEPGLITTGFSMNIVPRILGNGEMFLQYNIGLSDLASLKEVSSGSGGNKIQIPEVNTRGFLQNVKMRTGETLVLAGYESLLSSVTEQGTGHPLNWLFGGGLTAAKKRQILVILITPVLLEDNRPIAVR